MKAPAPHRPLVQAAAETLLTIFRDGAFADRAIERAMKAQRRFGSRDRRFFAETVYEVTRWWRLLNWIVGQEQLGRAAGTVAELSLADTQRVIAAHLVLASKPADILPEWLEVNAEELRNWRARAAEVDKPIAVAHSLPDWLEDFAARELGAAWSATIEGLNRQAPVFLRANTLKTSVAKLRLVLQSEEIETEFVEGVETALRLKERKNVFVTKAYSSGLFEMQDGGSQLIAPMLQPEPGERVIDACAGAGGKTLHLAAMMKNKGKLISLDVHERKLEELRQRTRRAGVDIVETRFIESRKVIKRLADSADRLLLDVPCSGSGVWRRKTDSRWKLSLDEIERVHQLQREILSDYTQMLRTGGTVVYATCSLWPSENEKQVEAFLSATKGRFRLVEEKKISPASSPFDGFYAAKMERLS